MPAANAEAMSLHLTAIGCKVAAGSHAALILDGAGYHLAAALTIPENVTLVRLPPYAPELNPIENVWEYLRGNKLAITVFDDYDDIVDKTCDAPAHSQAHRGRLWLDEDHRRSQKDKYRGLERVGWSFTIAAIAYNLIRLPRLMADRLMAKVPAFAKAFVGRWRIVEMDVWDKQFLDLVEEAHLTFRGTADGEIAFGALKGFLDVRYGSRDGSACAEFSWEGHDENDPACGRGWVVIGTAGRLVGHFYIHNGDDLGFVCERH